MINSEQILRFSSTIGSTPLFIQGAGGNLSWKEGNVLWVKASGTWLRDAKDKPIFIPLDLEKARIQAALGQENYTACLLNDSGLKPSIETAFHALLPEKIVVHCHMVDCIALSVTKNAQSDFEQRLSGLAWQWVDYIKPGAPLALAMTKKLNKASDHSINIWVLANHGIILAADTLEEIEVLLQDVTQRLSIHPRPPLPLYHSQALIDSWAIHGYHWAQDDYVHQLAVDPMYIALAETHWVLYPDHAVFLGAKAAICPAEKSPADFLQQHVPKPLCILIPTQGVLLATECTEAHTAMLRCYYEVASRCVTSTELQSLSEKQIQELLTWDAEKYRQALIKSADYQSSTLL